MQRKLPKKEELKAGSSGLTPDKVAKKLAKRAKHFLDTLAAEAEAAKQVENFLLFFIYKKKFDSLFFEQMFVFSFF